MAYLRQKNIFDQFGGDDGSGMLNFDQSASPYFGATDMGDETPDYSGMEDQQPSIPPQPDIPPQAPRPQVSTVAPRTYGGGGFDPEEIASMKTLMDQFYTPDTRASNRLNALLDNMPQERRPSLGRTIVSSLAGMGGANYETQQKMMDAPYLGDLEKWKMQLTPAQQAATLENQQNINERNLTNTMVTGLVNDRRNKSAAETAAAKQAGIDQKNADNYALGQARNAVAQAKNMGATFTVVGNKLIGHWPDGSSWEAGKAEDYSPTELETLKQKGRIASIEATGAQNRATETTKQTGRVEIQGMPSRTKVEDTPSEARMRQANSAIQITNDNPELSKYIKVLPGNIVQMTPPTAGLLGGVSAKLQKDFDDAKKAIYGGNAPVGTRTPTGVSGKVGGVDNIKVGSRVGDTAPQSEPIFQHSPSTGIYRGSNDGGKTWVYSMDGKNWSRTKPQIGGQ